MKKLFATLVMMSFFAIALPITADAQQRCYKPRRSSRTYQTRGYSYQKPSFYRRHRNLVNIAAATGGGALLGGLIGGRRSSMGKGALIGAGAGALYTYVLKPKKRRY